MRCRLFAEQLNGFTNYLYIVFATICSGIIRSWYHGIAVAWYRGCFLCCIVHILYSRLSNRGRDNGLLLFFGSFGQLAIGSQRIIFTHALAFSFLAVFFLGLDSDGAGGASIRNSRAAPRTMSALTSF